ncbi:ferredoxin reductase [Nocardioidaceae bacterium]|nr:ferredoxin reductase [Nocardioidaceae bacterium]
MSTNVSWEKVRRLGRQLTTPLLPDDYLTLINPLWSSRELRGRIEKVVPETDDAATVVIRPGWGWRYDHEAGQYVGIGLDVDGKIHWRSYSLSSAPRRSGGTITITVRAMPEGFLSDHLVNGVEPGTIVRLATPKGDFVLPSPPPEKVLFLVAGSGVTPVMSMLRTLDRRRVMPDVMVIYSSPTKDRMIFREELEAMQDKHPGFTLHEQFTDDMGMLGMEDIEGICPDYLERETWACGPGPMLDAAEEHWEEHEVGDRLHLERFSLDLGGDGAEGGTVTFQNSQKTIEADGATTILEAGEEKNIGMPYGCRMGICHTCTLTLVEGRVRDLRNGEEFTGPNEKIQTCVTAAAGDCTIDI